MIMKKTNFFYAAAIALVSTFGMTSCSVEDNPNPDPIQYVVEQVSLKDVPFYSVNKNADGDAAFGPNAKTYGEIAPAWEFNVPSSTPYGDPSVNNFADLSAYTKLIVVATEGTPRIMLNRDCVEGQGNAVEEEAHMIVNTVSGWNDKYFTVEENDGVSIWTVDLAQILKDKGWVHLNAIKGLSWDKQVTLSSAILEK